MKSKIIKKRKKRKLDNDRQPIVSIAIASTGMAVAGGIGAVICPPAMVVLGLAALLVGVLGESCNGGGDADGWGG
jgi:hypothetical protein